MSRKQLRHSTGQDAGMALPMVIILIIGLSLWMASVAILTRSTGATITQNIAQMQDRQRLVSIGISGMMDRLTPADPNAEILGVGTDLDPTGAQSCSKDPSTGRSYFTFDDPNLGDAGSGRIWVSCSETIESGAQQALASFLLVGTGHESQLATPTATPTRCLDDARACVTGVDGGLRINAAGGGVNRAVVTGGLINVSGAWDGVNANTLELKRPTTDANAPQIDIPIRLPAGSAEATQCPAAVGTVWGVGAGCACPAFFAATAQDGECPTGPPDAKSFQQLDPANTKSLVSSYLRSMLKRVVKEQSTSGLFTDRPAEIPVGCGTAQLYGSSGKYAIVIDASAGSLIGATELFALNNLTSDGTGTCSIGNGSDAKTPVLVLNGVFRFGPRTGDVANAMGPGNPKSKTKVIATNNVWQIKGANAVVIGGAPNATLTGCDPNYYGTPGNRTQTKGVNLQFAGSTYIDLPSGTLSLCPFYKKSSHVITVPTASLASQVSNLEFSWGGASGDANAFIQTAYGSTYSLETNGLLFAPAAYASLGLNSSSGALMNGGAVFRGLTLTTNASASRSGTVSPPPATNGDRKVQLRFWDSYLKRDLGIVQVVIRDQFGQQPAYAYSYTVWRTMW
jgi:hypothetical protein